MRTKALRLASLLGWVLALLLVNPVVSHAANRLSGAAYFDAVQCPAPPAGYESFTDYDGIVMTGSLEGSGTPTSSRLRKHRGACT